MAYSTQADILKVARTSLLSSLTDGAGGAVDTAILNEAIEEADLLIDGFLGSIYGPTPLTTPPARIKHLSINLTLYNLATRPGQTGIDVTIEERGRHELKYLERVAAGEAVVPGLTPMRKFVRRQPDQAVPILGMRREDSDGKIVSWPNTGGSLDNY